MKRRLKELNEQPIVELKESIHSERLNKGMKKDKLSHQETRWLMGGLRASASLLDVSQSAELISGSAREIPFTG